MNNRRRHKQVKKRIDSIDKQRGQTPIIRYKPITKTMMAKAYGVDLRTFNIWLEPLLKKVGKPHGRLFTPLQIKHILSALGTPDNPQFLRERK